MMATLCNMFKVYFLKLLEHRWDYSDSPQKKTYKRKIRLKNRGLKKSLHLPELNQGWEFSSSSLKGLEVGK